MGNLDTTVLVLMTPSYAHDFSPILVMFTAH